MLSKSNWNFSIGLWIERVLKYSERQEEEEEEEKMVEEGNWDEEEDEEN